MVTAVLITLVLVLIVTLLWFKWKYHDIEKYLEENYKNVKKRQLIEKRRD